MSKKKTIQKPGGGGIQTNSQPTNTRPVNPVVKPKPKK